MNLADPFTGPSYETNSRSPSPDFYYEVAHHFVGKFRKGMSDEERELHIKNCGWLMEDAMRRYCETGDFGYRGEADRWKLLMQEAIKARPAEFVSKLEQERGLA